MADTHYAKDYAVRLITRWEGFLDKPVVDTLATKQVVQIGYGTTEINGMPVSPDHVPITKEQALIYVNMHLDYDLHCISAQLGDNVSSCQLGALLSFAYNEGLRRLMTSNIIIFAGGKRHVDAALEMMEFSFAGGKFIKGLHNRRRSEAYTYLTGLLDFETGDPPLPPTLQV